MSRIIAISMDEMERRVAMIVNNKLEFFAIERESEKRIVGNIYKGRVVNVHKSIQAAFVDVGLGRNGFLHVSDVVDASSGVESIIEEDFYEDEEEEILGQKRNIEDMVKEKQEILVQVIKEPIRTKGVRLSSNITFPGRYLVFMPNYKRRGISRKIEDRQERRRLKEIVDSLKVPEGMGLIVRTAGEGKPKKFFARDYRYLMAQWKQLQKKARKAPPLCCIHTELDLVIQTVRDSFTEEVDKLVIDSKDEFKRVRKFINSVMPNFRSKLEISPTEEPIFAYFGIENEIRKIFNRKIWLRGGGYIIIERTEALVAVDVNSGRQVSGKDMEEMVLSTNLEASEEIARQLKLKNLGGIIIIDYIDMKSRKNRLKVMQRLKSALRDDKAKNNILPISDIGILEMTRQRIRESTHSEIFEACTYCNGIGKVKSTNTISIEILREVNNLIDKKRVKTLKLIANPEIAGKIEEGFPLVIKKIRRRIRNFQLEQDSGLHVTDYKIIE
ncbi:MAG: Rne/Rng family ribonuclease [Candidatus Theseobacter exili]|nr:Rne/Rng family ribonuclease [Candidatus Theseobacter exili]